MNFLNDKEFLKQLDQIRTKNIYARVTALDFNENILQSIEGVVTQGSINVDGASAVRRTCSLTIVTNSFDYQNYHWAKKTKFKLEVGVQNDINVNYPKVCWFNQGIYVITSINTSRSTNNFTITIQGKDKMCLLNGDIAGNLEAQTDFGKIEEENALGEWTIRSLSIVDIIRNLVHQYAKEPYHNIIINDLDTYGLELLEYRSDEPIFLVREKNSNNYNNITFDRKCEYKNYITTLNTLDNSVFDPLVDQLFDANQGEIIVLDNDEFKIAKVKYGDTAGYRITELTYAGDLIGNAGETLTSILDKIKNMLIEFEYFYDLEGRFIFQKKQSFLNTIWTPGDLTERPFKNFEGLALQSNYSYEFKDHTMFSAFNVTPNITNVKNDYSIWGQKTTIQGATIPIHLRYAIDNKPIQYRNIEVPYNLIEQYNSKYGTTLKGQKTFVSANELDKYNEQYLYIAAENYNVGHETDSFGKPKGIFISCDWREVLYQMALDYFRYNWLDDFEIRLAQANPELYPTGRTNYEQYYTDIQGFWRQLYNPEINENIDKKEIQKQNNRNQIDALNYELQQNYEKQKVLKETIKENEANSNNAINQAALASSSVERKQYLDEMYKFSIMLSNNEQALKECENLIEKLLNEQTILNEECDKLEQDIKTLQSDKNNYNYNTEYHKYWNQAVFESPELLIFWFDFLDSNGELSQISVPNIGDRTKVINDTNIKTIYNRDTPSIIFTEDITKLDEQIINTDFRTVQIDNIENMFSLSPQGKSAKEKLDELIYQHGYCAENITITSIPIYYLEPNSRIYVIDEKTNVNGDYILSKISIPLTYNGTMSLTASKAAEYLI